MKQVKVAVIDSGVELNHPFLSFRKISGIEITSNGKEFFYKNNIFDDNGHGTAIAGIIFDKCPKIEMISIKILDQNLKCTFTLLAEALRFAMSCEVDIINLSLGTIKEGNKLEFETICDEAVDQGILIVASFNNENDHSYPAAFPSVFGVKSGYVPYKYGYGFNKESFTVYANGSRQKVCSPNSTYTYTSGNSYACAHFTGILATLLFNDMQKDRKLILEYLTQHCIPIREMKSFEKLNPFQHIKRGLIFPLSKESIDLVKEKSGVTFTVSGIYDDRPQHFNYYDLNNSLGQIKLFHLLEEGLENSDTLLIGDISFIPERKKEEIIYNLVSRTINLGRNVLSKEAFPSSVYEQLYEQALKKNVFICSKYI